MCIRDSLTTSYGTFSSFGDCNGNRNDFYRQLMLQKSHQLDTAIKYSADELSLAFHSLVNGNKISEDFISIFDQLGYTKGGIINVPVYYPDDFKVGDEASKIVIDACSQTLIECLNLLSREQNLLSIQHNIDVRDIANEIYHLILSLIHI